MQFLRLELFDQNDREDVRAKEFAYFNTAHVIVIEAAGDRWPGTSFLTTADGEIHHVKTTPDAIAALINSR